MYPGFDVATLFPEAEKFVMDNDRHLYDPFFEAAEKFCIKGGILIGGRTGIDLLIGAPLTKDGYFWELYTDNAFETAKEFATMLSQVKSPHIPARTVALRTDIKHREFTILVNANYLFKIYSMDRYRGVKLIEVMKPPTATGYFGGSVSVIPDEIQLIDIYRTLYSPSRMKNWERDLATEAVIYAGVRAREKHIVVGGAIFNRSKCDEILLQKLFKVRPKKSSSSASSHRPSSTPSPTSSSTPSSPHTPPPQYILIGDYAAHLWLMHQGHKSKGGQRLQFISADPIEALISKVEKIIIHDKNAARKIGAPFEAKVSSVKFNLNVPSDFQITKHTLYVNFQNEQIPIADVFNSTEYEAIPYILAPGGDTIVDTGDEIVQLNETSVLYSVGNPFVILKFIFIDIWIIRLLVGMSQSGKQEFFQERILSLMLWADEIRKKTLELIQRDPLSVFQLSNYAGVSINETVAKKKFIKEIGDRFRIFYPARASEESKE